MTDQPIDQFLDRLASSTATPGGGSAAAIMGAMGAALVSMVCHLTIGKKNYEAVAEEMQSVLADAERLRAELTALVPADIAVFDQVMAAYGQPKDTENQKQSRSAAIQAALKAATEVPLACARLSAAVIRLSRTAARHGNRNVVSDAGAAVMAAYGALKSAALNVYVNAGSIKDEPFVTPRVGELEQLLAECETAAQEVFLEVKNRL
jgi:formiminotetrahydrofolate cyclodeaminase